MTGVIASTLVSKGLAGELGLGGEPLVPALDGPTLDHWFQVGGCPVGWVAGRQAGKLASKLAPFRQ